MLNRKKSNMIYLIKVTVDHINKGRRGSCSDCPVALAIKDVVFGFRRIVVGPFDVDFYVYDHLGTNKTVEFPLHVTKFIENYDCHRGVPQPFEFELDLTG